MENLVPLYTSTSRKEKYEFARVMRERQTEAESVLWERLRRKQLGFKIRRQHVVLGYIADFFCFAAQLCIEVDGGYHTAKTDRKRDANLAKHGIETIRFTNLRVISETDAVCKEITNALVIASRRNEGINDRLLLMLDMKQSLERTE